MEEHASRRHDATRVGIERPSSAIHPHHARIRDSPPIDTEIGADINALSLNRDNSLDQRRITGCAEPAAQISACPCLGKWSRGRRANEDKIADRDRPIQRADAPEAERSLGVMLTR
ncbi:hypothetical protein N182_30665 [Sinorhizobium sp. GL2]|nr:hypothetical protein N182_30665 [Sinorhizobium sp. GL2]